MRILPYVMHHPSRPFPRTLVDELSQGAHGACTVIHDTTTRGPWATARDCWLAGGRACADGVGTHVLVCHDDALPALRMMKALEAAVTVMRDQVITLFNDHAAARKAELQELSWIRFETLCWGLGVVMPGHLALRFVDFCDRHTPGEWKSDDARLKIWMAAEPAGVNGAAGAGRGFWATVPSLLDHNTMAPATPQDHEPYTGRASVFADDPDRNDLQLENPGRWGTSWVSVPGNRAGYLKQKAAAGLYLPEGSLAYIEKERAGR